MKFIVGKKIGMSQVFLNNGTVVPVTRIQAGPCVVTQIKSQAKDGVDAVQVGFGIQKAFRLSRPEQGHLKGIDMGTGLTVRFLRERPMAEAADLKRGDVFTVKVFSPGEKVQVVGTSKGKGFQGVVKRHGFHGGPKTHGQSDRHRAPGSIGMRTTPGRVWKGKKMAGHYGMATKTIRNLKVINFDETTNILTISGTVPGHRHSLLKIHKLPKKPNA